MALNSFAVFAKHRQYLLVKATIKFKFFLRFYRLLEKKTFGVICQNSAAEPKEIESKKKPFKFFLHFLQHPIKMIYEKGCWYA